MPATISLPSSFNALVDDVFWVVCLACSASSFVERASFVR